MPASVNTMEDKKITTVCFPVAELLWFCGQIHINYCFVCKQMWGGFWEKQHTQRMVVAGMCPIMIVNRLWVGPLQWDQILQSDKKKKKKIRQWWIFWWYINIQSHCPWSLEHWSTASRHHRKPNLWREGFCTGPQTQHPCLCAWCVRTAQFALQHHSFVASNHRAQMTTHSQTRTLKSSRQRGPFQH